jgi:hypothetical protein
MWAHAHHNENKPRFPENARDRIVEARKMYWNVRRNIEHSADNPPTRLTLLKFQALHVLQNQPQGPTVQPGVLVQLRSCTTSPAYALPLELHSSFVFLGWSFLISCDVPVQGAVAKWRSAYPLDWVQITSATADPFWTSWWPFSHGRLWRICWTTVGDLHFTIRFKETHNVLDWMNASTVVNNFCYPSLLSHLYVGSAVQHPNLWF